MTSRMCVRGVPEVERSQRGGFGHVFAVAAHGGRDDPVARRRPEAPFERDDVHARRQPLDVPLPRSRQGLVEVVDVEDQAASGSGELAEVADVRVAARFDPEAGHRARRRDRSP